VQADREALGKAIADGKPEPDDEAVAAVDVELEAVRRRHEAISVAIRAAEDELTAAIEEHRMEWSAKMAGATVSVITPAWRAAPAGQFLYGEGYGYAPSTRVPTRAERSSP
jgi:hypothetical protein